MQVQRRNEILKSRPSFRARIAFHLVRAVVKGWPRNDSAALVRRARRVFGQPGWLRFMQARGVAIEEVPGDIAGEWLTPDNFCSYDPVLLYLHGGGYVSCSPETHRPVTTALARLLGWRVFSLAYRLAPEHPFPAAVDDAVNCYRWLMGCGFKPQHIAIAGDSAGGGLTMATMLRLREEGVPLPACAACLSPWVDLTDESRPTNTDSCAMFVAEDGPAFASIYLNGASAKSPLASPLYADLKGLPPLLVQVSRTEMLFDNAQSLHDKAVASGVESRLHVYPSVPHVWQMFAGVMPEADQALREIAEFVMEKVGVVSPL